MTSLQQYPRIILQSLLYEHVGAFFFCRMHRILAQASILKSWKGFLQNLPQKRTTNLGRAIFNTSSGCGFKYKETSTERRRITRNKKHRTMAIRKPSSNTDPSFNKDYHRSNSSSITVTAADESCEPETRRRAVLSKVEQVAGSQPGYVLKAISKLTPENAELLCDYILAEQTAFNISESTKESKITRLAWLALHCKNKPYTEMTTADIQSFLDSGRKPDQDDPLHKWIGYYNTKIKIFTKFFRWLYYYHRQGAAWPEERKTPPPPMQGIRFFLFFLYLSLLISNCCFLMR
jgi:hypothetical protein